MQLFKNKILPVLMPVVIFGAFLMLWELGVLHWLLNVKPYILPVPSEIFDKLIEQFAAIWHHTACTLKEVFVGLLIGSAIGLAISIGAVVFPIGGHGSLTLVSGVNAIPIVALAPIMSNLFGIGAESKIAVVAVFTIAPMTLNAFRGFTELKPYSLDLLRTYSVGRVEEFFNLRLPNCFPNILTALRINTTAGMLAAICSEFFTSEAGIGFQISTTLNMAQNALAWAYILMAAICGIVMYCVILVIEKFCFSWHVSQR